MPVRNPRRPGTLFGRGDRTAVAGVRARRLEESDPDACTVKVTVTGATSPAGGKDGQRERALKVWFPGPESASQDEVCDAATRLADKVIRTLPGDGDA